MSPDIHSEEPVAQGPPRRPPEAGRLVVALLVLPVAAVLAIPLYDRIDPRIGGVPFFYWYQFACLLFTFVCLASAFGVRDRRLRLREEPEQ